MDQDEHCRKAAHIIAELLASTLMKAEHEGRHLYIWEIEGIEWLRLQWELDPATLMNMWTADRYVRNTELDLLGRASPQRSTIFDHG